MHAADGQPPIPACPLIDRDDPACRSRFTLTRLSDAFDLCFGDYRRCPHYQRLTGSPTTLVTPLTHHGRQLRPTGT